MNNRIKYLIKNTGILTISNLSSKILVLALVPLYTMVLSTSEYGIYDLIVSTITLLYPILTNNITDAVMRFAMDKNNDINAVIFIGLKHIVFSIALFVLGLVLLSKIELFTVIFGLEIYIALYYVSYIFANYFIQVAKGLEHVFDMGMAGVFSTIVLLIGNIMLLLVFKLGLKGFLIASIMSQFTQVIYLAVRIKFWKYLKYKENVYIHKKMLKYSVPLIATALGWWVNSVSDKYVVVFMCGIAANGILSVAYKIPQILNTLQGIFIQAWQISAIKEYGKKDTTKFYGDTFNIINMLMCAVCAWMILLSKPLASLLYARDFYVAWQYVPFLLISSVLNCASGLLGPILAAQKKSKEMANSAIIGATINVFLNILLIYLIGIQGATIATVVSSYIIYHVRKKAVGTDICIKDYYIVLLTWLLLSVQAFVEIYTSFWKLELIIMLVMLWLNRSQIVNLFSKLKSIVKK